MKSLIALSVVFVALLSSPSVDAQLPPPFDPSDWGPWGPTTEEQVSSIGGIPLWWGEHFTKTRSRTGVYCAPVADPVCGGGGSVAAGTEITLPDGIAKYRLKREYQFPFADDPCWLCNIYICFNATFTEIEHLDKSPMWKRINGKAVREIIEYSWTDNFIVPDPSTAAVKQACDKSDAARDFCCPDLPELPTEDSEAGYSLTPGDCAVIVDQVTLGPGSGGTAGEIDLLDLGALISFEAGVSAVLPWLIPADTGELLLYAHAASSVAELSLWQRAAIHESVLRVVEQESPSGHLLVSVGFDDAPRFVIDLGKLESFISSDPLYLENPADIDGDGVVTQADLDIAEADLETNHFGARGDVTLDGVVDELDLQLILDAMSGG